MPKRKREHAGDAAEAEASTTAAAGRESDVLSSDAAAEDIDVALELDSIDSEEEGVSGAGSSTKLSELFRGVVKVRLPPVVFATARMQSAAIVGRCSRQRATATP
jgi:hypothetical protein